MIVIKLNMTVCLYYKSGQITVSVSFQLVIHLFSYLTNAIHMFMYMYVYIYYVVTYTLFLLS